MLQREHSAILSTFIKLPCVIKYFFSMFQWPLKTGFTDMGNHALLNIHTCSCFNYFIDDLHDCSFTLYLILINDLT